MEWVLGKIKIAVHIKENKKENMPHGKGKYTELTKLKVKFLQTLKP